MTINRNITYVSSNLVVTKNSNEDMVDVSTNLLSPEGDIFSLDFRMLSQSAVITTKALNELQPEISEVIPKKIVPPTGSDGSTLLQTPSTNTVPDVAQNYYTPLVFERFKPEIIRLLERGFTELSTTGPSRIELPPGE